MPEEFLRKIDEYEENIRLNIVKKDFKDLGNKEITGKIYVVLDQKNNEEEIVINSGDYATISSIGHFDGEEGRKVLLELLSWIKENKISYDDFKVNYIKSENGDVSYEERLKAIREIGFVVTGFPDIHNPKIELAITKVKDKWIFGELIKNNFKWQKHNDKPYSYSNAVPLRMARALVNIAVGDNRELTLGDPCCGIGTVVIEALDLGIDVKGYEISKPIAYNARNNIEFLGYNREIITSGDMHNINETFDVAIVDIPYGLFSPVTLKEQMDIINTSRRIARKLVIITFEDMDNLIISAGFKIVEKCYMTKGNMTRQISICV